MVCFVGTTLRGVRHGCLPSRSRRTRPLMHPTSLRGGPRAPGRSAGAAAGVDAGRVRTTCPLGPRRLHREVTAQMPPARGPRSIVAHCSPRHAAVSCSVGSFGHLECRLTRSSPSGRVAGTGQRRPTPAWIRRLFMIFFKSLFINPALGESCASHKPPLSRYSPQFSLQVSNYFQNN